MNYAKLNHFLVIVIIMPSLLLFSGYGVYDYFVWDINCHKVGCPNEIYSFVSVTWLMFVSLLITEVVLIYDFVSNRR